MIPVTKVGRKDEGWRAKATAEKADHAETLNRQRLCDLSGRCGCFPLQPCLQRCGVEAAASFFIGSALIGSAFCRWSSWFTGGIRDLVAESSRPSCSSREFDSVLNTEYACSVGFTSALSITPCSAAILLFSLIGKLSGSWLLCNCV